MEIAFVLFTILGLLISIRNHILRTKELTFHYVSGSITPDKIHVYYNKMYIYSYNWINGVDAPLYSLLEAVHSKYQQSIKN